MSATIETVLGAPVARLEGPEKVRGEARYAFEQQQEADCVYAWPVQSSIVAGTITGFNTDEVLALPGVVAVMTHENAPHLEDAEDAELLVLQSPEVAYRGQVVGVVVAETIDAAREAAARLVPVYDSKPAGATDVVLTVDSPRLYAPDQVNAGFATDSDDGDVDAAFAAAAFTVDATYSTPPLFNSPMEPHATTARWHDGRFDIVNSSQSTSGDQQTVATQLGVPPEHVRVLAHHVGGGFGSKGSARPNLPLVAMVARVVGRPVKLAYTRPMMFAISGYRTPTFSRIRLAADADGRLTAIEHDAFSQTSTIQEFAEQTGEATRHLYAAPNRRVTHRVAKLDVPTPRWMRAPGETPGIYALEAAMDELAEASGIDPVELRIRNDAAEDPATGQAFSSRNLVGCLRRGAELFGWAGRDPRPGVRREGRWLVGTGVASAVLNALAMPSGARIRALPDGRYAVGVNATDIGQGARTVLAQIAADALTAPLEAIDITIGDSDLPTAPVAGGSSGTQSWGWAITKAAQRLQELLADGQPVPPDGLEVVVDTTEDVAGQAPYTRMAFGAHFVEARVDMDSGEVVVPRAVSVFAAGRILNARLARSQFLGAMTMGLSMALHEDGELDPAFGDIGNHDFATYHVASNADVQDLRVEWLDEHDEHLAPMGGKGIGEIGIVGIPAAVTSAVRHATGVRVRALPVQPDALVSTMPARF